MMLEALLRRERAVVGMALAALTALAWLYVWRGAGMGMPAREMTALALFPHRYPEAMGGMAMMPVGWLAVAAMWWVMMIAMMTPSAAPLVLLYGRVLRQHAAATPDRAYVPSLFLVAGYLAAWLVFAAVTAGMQVLLLAPAGLISGTMLWSRSALLSASLLAAAGLYQLSPLKGACLAQCRSPVEFLTRHWRAGRLGALRLGALHGAWCVGCCWILMALLFVGGVMNLAWIAILTLLVAIEKLAPAGPWVGKAAGGLLLVWAAATLLAA